MNLKLVATIISLTVLSGCARFYPLPVEEPSAYVKKGNQDVRRTPDYQRGGLLPAVNIEEAIENLKIYGDAYQVYGDMLRRNEYISSDTLLAGGILGVVGGVAKSAETAIAGAVLGAGASIISERYQLLVQATNYENASDSMYCMYVNLYPVAGGGVSYQFVNEKIDEVRRKLRKVQSSVQLASPDLGKLETSLNDLIESKREKQTAKTAVEGGNNSKSALHKLDNAETKLVEAELMKCVAAF